MLYEVKSGRGDKHATDNNVTWTSLHPFPCMVSWPRAAMLLDVRLSWPEAALTITVLIGKTQTPF